MQEEWDFQDYGEFNISKCVGMVDDMVVQVAVDPVTRQYRRTTTIWSM